MKVRWGSCSTSRSALLNTEVVKASMHCIDYVACTNRATFATGGMVTGSTDFSAKLYPTVKVVNGGWKIVMLDH
jgi:hypothetical protein